MSTILCEGSPQGDELTNKMESDVMKLIVIPHPHGKDVDVLVQLI